MSDSTTTTPHFSDASADDGPRRRRFLPPPPTRLQLIFLVLALLYLAGSVGYFLGSPSSGHPGKNSVDVGFLHDMISHHEQAVAMATVELGAGADNGTRVFAREILTLQAYEIGLMDKQLADWGQARQRPRTTAMAWMGMPVEGANMPGMASEAEMAALDDARGRDADALFIPLMQDHHRGGVHMAEFAAKNAESEFVRTLAARMARNQRIEVNELEGARARANLPTNPPAYVPSEIPASTHEPDHH